VGKLGTHFVKVTSIGRLLLPRTVELWSRGKSVKAAAITIEEMRFLLMIIESFRLS
jgi:hypothetical protein